MPRVCEFLLADLHLKNLVSLYFRSILSAVAISNHKHKNLFCLLSKCLVFPTILYHWKSIASALLVFVIEMSLFVFSSVTAFFLFFNQLSLLCILKPKTQNNLPCSLICCYTGISQSIIVYFLVVKINLDFHFPFLLL